jgi:hypothetical protein
MKTERQTSNKARHDLGTYVAIRSNDSPYPTKYPHLIKYPNGAFGTRTDNGQVFVQVRRPEDEDIVKILTERKQHA